MKLLLGSHIFVQSITTLSIKTYEAQAISEPLTFLTADELLQGYSDLVELIE